MGRAGPISAIKTSLGTIFRGTVTGHLGGMIVLTYILVIVYFFHSKSVQNQSLLCGVLLTLKMICYGVLFANKWL